ncbi:chemotaxis protein CheA [Malikia sp.]|uniref:chemotaxis protein CheA n=1 Tax=Malikia sp. TaxID=2070706 RepID=UPI002606AC6A|nr:chemotaxis protein CheA [Malikia sp.]MDD2728707.1 chemotaxis protein CheA [Malikia sp.]
MKDVFLLEARDQLEALETTLLALERDPGDETQIHGAFRAAHTIKGSSSMAEAMGITAFTHNVENVLQRMRDGELVVESELVSALLGCADHIRVLLDFFARDADIDEPTRSQGQVLLARLKPWLEPASVPRQIPLVASPSSASGRGGEECLGSDAWHISLRLGQEIFQRGVEPIGLIRYLAGLGELVRVLPITDALPAPEQMDAELCYLGFEMAFRGAVVRADIEDAFAFLQGECVLHILPPHSPLAELGRVLQVQAPGREVELAQQLRQVDMLDLDDEALLIDWLAGQQSEDAAPVPVPVPQAETDELAAPAAVASDAVAPRRAQPGQPSVPAHAQLRVDADKLDRLVDLVGELVIAGAAASVIAARVGREDLNEALSVLSGLIEDMRDSAMQMRMVQIGATFNRFQRVVRDVSRELGKEIELLTEGGETELDKSVVEKIGDPLMHLVRNSMDHGIESAELRLARGKPARGRLTLRAQHEAGSILIQIRDDGGGLDTERILAKAVERKLVQPKQTLTEAEIHQLIFEPGFSTAEQVTELSGRGVGMDVVRRNIQALRGSVTVESRPGQGCAFTIRLPLTLAIIDGFRVGIGDSHFVIPLDMVAECIQHDRQARSCDYINLRGKLLPFVRLRELFGDEGDSAVSDVAENLVVVKHGGQQVGIVVEKLYGEMQAVIKPLGVMFQGIKGLAGCTLLGTGEIAVILDIPSLIAQLMRSSVNHAAAVLE